MNLPGKKMLVVAGAAALLSIAVVISVAADETGMAILCVAGVQLVTLLAVMLVNQSQRRLEAQGSRQEKLMGRIERQVANVATRSVTEARATERSIRGRIVKANTQTQTRLRSVQRHLDRRGEEHVQDVEALVQLFGRITPRAAMPSSGRWALEPTGLLRLVDLVASTDVRTIVELGSGTSSLWLAYALEKRGTGGRVISLDHDPHFAAMTRAALEAHGFADGPVDVRDAPLVDLAIPDHGTQWYDPEAFADLSDIDLVIVDGPPEATGEAARYPALPALLDRLAPGAVIVVDDAGREAETQMVVRWRAEVPTLKPMDQAGPGRQVYLRLGD